MYPYDFFTKYRVDSLLNRVFVGMWFDPAHRPRYDNIISVAIERCQGLQSYRVDQPVSGGSIPINILEGILNSKIVLFETSYITSPDSTGKRYRNPNVMYELGLAHAWRLSEEIIVLKDDHDSLPFDINVFRVHEYNPNDINGSIGQIVGILTGAISEIDRAKSIMVEKAAKSIDSRCLGFMHENKGHYFSEPRYDPITANIINRLLDLGILWLDTSGGGGTYAYHWTELGRDVMKYLGISLLPKNVA